MTTSEYLLNAAFVLLVLRQARERELDRRSVIVPLVLMFFVGAQYLHTVPTAGNDLTIRVKGDPEDAQLLADVEEFVVPVALRRAPVVTVIIDPSLCG